MGILRSIESRIEGAFEGTFGRAFRANVEPVELARKLAKELEDHKVVSVSQTYAPTSYTVYLHPKDRERFSEYEVSLRTELAVYLAEHARREGYAMTTRPRVVFETEPALALGTFGIATEIGETEEPPADPAATREAAPAPVEPAAEEPEPEPEPAPAAEEPPAEPSAAADGVPPAPPVPEAVPVVPPPLPLPVPVPADVAPPAEPEAGADEDAATVHYTAAEASAAAPSPARSSSTAGASRSGRPPPSSAARRRATSSSTTRTPRGATPRSAARAPGPCSWTSSRRTGRRSTGSGSASTRWSTGIGSRSARRRSRTRRPRRGRAAR